MFISLSQAKQNITIGTSTIHSDIIRLHWIYSFFPGSEFEHTNRLFISLQFRSFLLTVKQGKRLSKFLQKYTDSGTETTHLAGYDILVFKYVKISASLPLLFIGAIGERSSKIRYCIIWRCLHLMFSTKNVSEK